MDFKKEQVVADIKEWIKCDNEIRQLQKEIKARKTIQNKLASNILNTMKSKEIDSFELNDGKLIYTQTKIKGSLNKNYLIKCIGNYFSNLEDKEIANNLTEYILENRETKIKESIKRKINK
jgi:seryl-tRNA synthetase